MGQVDPRQVVEDARAGGWAVGAFNMHNPETTQALVAAAEQAKAPVFLQVGRALVPHVGLRAAYEMTKAVAEQSDAEYVIHLDHGPWEEVFEAIKLGFGSIMYDGAHLPLDENIRSTRKVVQVAHAFGIPVEAELGKIPDAGQEVDWDAYFTDVAEAERFVAETGVDFLAISVGIVHGIPTSATARPLDIARVKEIRETVGIPLVLHGASGVPENEIRAAIDAGVHKFNADTDLRHAFRSGIEAVFATGDRQLEDALAEGRTRMTAATVEKMDLYGASGRAKGGGVTAVAGLEGTATKLAGIRRTAARRMVTAWQAPVFHLGVEVDMTAAGAARAGVPGATVTDVLLHACAQTLREHPGVNAHYGEEVVTSYEEVNLGVAVATDAGLMVPVLHGAQRLDLAGTASGRRDLTGRARDGKLAMADVTGGTFTVSNLGMLGIDRFDAILNVPQVAILAVGTTRKKQVWVDGTDEAESGAQWRPVCELTLTCDHRALDGATAARFLSALRSRLESGDPGDARAGR